MSPAKSVSQLLVIWPPPSPHSHRSSPYPPTQPSGSGVPLPGPGLHILYTQVTRCPLPCEACLSHYSYPGREPLTLLPQHLAPSRILGDSPAYTVVCPPHRAVSHTNLRFAPWLTPGSQNSARFCHVSDGISPQTYEVVEPPALFTEREPQAFFSYVLTLPQCLESGRR